jgi:molybdate transport system substrate-binding protein
MPVIHVLSAGAAKGLVSALAEPFRQASGHMLQCQFGAVGAMQERLDAGDACDLIILSRAMIDALASRHRVDAASVADLGRVRTGVAALAGAAAPPVADEAQLRRALTAAPSIYIPDPVRSTAGIHCMKVLTALGIADAVGARIKAYPNGATAMAEMAHAGDARAVGVTQITEILYTPGVALVAALPAAFELSTVYSAAVTTSPLQREAATAFLQLLTGASSAELRRAGGFEPS